MRENKVVLPLIIFLLILVLPFSSYGLYYQIKEKIRTANPNHLAKIGDLLYFYNAKNKLVGTYNCVFTIKTVDEKEKIKSFTYSDILIDNLEIYN